MTTGKAPGPDAIPAEVYKTGGETIRSQLTSLFQSMWYQMQLPQEFRDATIVHIYKRKGNRQSCDNHRGISLLSIAGKILARVLLNRLLEHLEQGLLPESQCGFRAGRGTTDMIFAAHDGEPSEAFPVTNGVKQGCVLAPTLFSLMFSAMLSDAFRDCDPGLDIRYQYNGKLFNRKLFNPRRLQAVTKVKETVLRDFLFADDCAVNASNKQEMQALNKQYHKPQITVNGQTLQAVESFTYGYLGSTLSRNANIDAEINNRVSKVCSAFGRLREKVWERRGISLNTKLKVYHAVVLTTLLYGCETWTAYRRHEKLINHFHLRCLRNILHIRWQDKVPDTKVLKHADLPSAITIMRKAQLRWAGHVSRMPDDHIPKQLFYGELCSGKRTVGGQRKRYKDSLKVSLKDFNISTESWESLASDRPSWRQCITKGAQAAEKRRSCQAEEKRAAHKGRAVSTNSTAPTHFCSTCGRGFLAQIGLISHLWTHQRS
ncbi:hypothetical protein ACROYT_G030473 [Oculina patagonica]